MLLAAVEEEFRGIVEFFAGDEEPTGLLSEELHQNALTRRRRDGVQGTPATLAPLLPYLDFQDAYELAIRIKQRLPGELANGLQALGVEIPRIVGARNRVAHNRPLDVDDLPIVADFTAGLENIPGWDWARIRETRTEIRNDPGYVFRAAASLIADPDTAVANNLPVPDFDETSLLGRKDERRMVMRALRGSWPVISILGDGGIGKTALALQVCYDLVEQPDCPFAAVVWVTAKNAQLTSTEIVRIESAVEDSLGLFASATAALGGSGDPGQAVEELLDVLEIFPTLLVLDNVETVLDEHFPGLLRDIPPGSKVLITSRIGVKTENPFKISGLSVDDAKKLMRILARARGFDLQAIATDEDLGNWAKRMNCHPAYIKWFLSGIQTGQRPEALLNDNGLVLDFCMSNVFEFLTDHAKAALEAMLVVPGSHTMAELAFLTEFDSRRIQEVVLELTTTNFVSQVRGGASGTALELSDFARAYLRRSLRIDPQRRWALTEKQKQLYAVGGGLQAAHALDPYDVDTIDVRGVGDYSAAKQLREALDLNAEERYDEALRLCAEAAELAPGYHEAARIEAHIHESSTNFGEAFESYSRAKDLAPEDPHVAYFFGNFMIRSGFDPAQGLRELQRAAKLNPESSFLQLAISQAHLDLGDLRLALDASAYAIAASEPGSASHKDGLFFLWRASAFGAQAALANQNWDQLAEDVEFALATSAGALESDYGLGTLDLMLWVEDMSATARAETPDNYIATRLRGLVGQINAKRRTVDASHLARRVGKVENLVERGFGFLTSKEGHYFFHARQLWDRREFDQLVPGSTLVFTPGSQPASGKPEATSVHWVG